MSQQKQETITFKVDSALAHIIKRLPNRSEFIRKAILNAVDNTCPLCQGSGIITPEQRPHWEAFLETHHIEQCGECSAVFIACDEDHPGPGKITDHPAP
ncbi:ribbon-helix-helix domain-containing protein [Spirochaeta lutea]|uniref:hypothetical protein n=1 Tax=Spirochaeta lutea TaxID=1480694 RepID=UPI000690F920|nr:hypothetical protein [Spirochaeta lutea]